TFPPVAAVTVPPPAALGVRHYPDPAEFNALSPLTTPGELILGGTAGAGPRLPGNTTATIGFLCQLGDGSQVIATAWNGLSGMLDTIFGSAQGSILYRASGGWTTLGPGTADQVLT